MKRNVKNKFIIVTMCEKILLMCSLQSYAINIQASFPTKSVKGAVIPMLDKELCQYITNVDFVMSQDKKSVIAIMDVPDKNKTQVEAIIAKKNDEVTEDNIDEMEKKYHGLKKRMERQKNKQADNAGR